MIIKIEELQAEWKKIAEKVEYIINNPNIIKNNKLFSAEKEKLLEKIVNDKVELILVQVRNFFILFF